MWVVAFDSLCVWSALGVVSAICDVGTVYGQARSVCLTVRVMLCSLREPWFPCVVVCSYVLGVWWGLMWSVMCCLCVEGLVHSSAQKTASRACPFSPHVRNPPGGPFPLRTQKSPLTHFIARP